MNLIAVIDQTHLSLGEAPAAIYLYPATPEGEKAAVAKFEAIVLEVRREEFPDDPANDDPPLYAEREDGSCRYEIGDGDVTLVRRGVHFVDPNVRELNGIAPPADSPIKIVDGSDDEPTEETPLDLLESLLSITERFKDQLEPTERDRWQWISATCADLREGPQDNEDEAEEGEDTE